MAWTRSVHRRRTCCKGRSSSNPLARKPTAVANEEAWTGCESPLIEVAKKATANLLLFEMHQPQLSARSLVHIFQEPTFQVSGYCAVTQAGSSSTEMALCRSVIEITSLWWALKLSTD